MSRWPPKERFYASYQKVPSVGRDQHDDRDHDRVGQNGIKAIDDAAMPGEDRAEVLDAELALDQGEGKTADIADDRHQESDAEEERPSRSVHDSRRLQKRGMGELQDARDKRRIKSEFANGGKAQGSRHRKHEAAEKSFPRLMGRNPRVHTMLSKEDTDEVSSDVRTPRPDEHEDKSQTGIERLAQATILVIIRKIGFACHAGSPFDRNGRAPHIRDSRAVWEIAEEEHALEAQGEEQSDGKKIGDIRELDLRRADSDEEQDHRIEDDSQYRNKDIIQIKRRGSVERIGVRRIRPALDECPIDERQDEEIHGDLDGQGIASRAGGLEDLMDAKNGKEDGKSKKGPIPEDQAGDDDSHQDKTGQDAFHHRGLGRGR